MLVSINLRAFMDLAALQRLASQTKPFIQACHGSGLIE